MICIYLIGELPTTALSSHLEELYPELYGEICKFLDLSTLASFALTSKSNYAKYFDHRLMYDNGFPCQCIRDKNLSLMLYALEVPFPFSTSHTFFPTL